MKNRYTQFLMGSTVRIYQRIQYEITRGCNLRCVHCSDFTKNSHGQLAIADIIHFHRSLQTFGAIKAVISGGEPFLHPECLRLISELASFSPVSINTNGTVVAPTDLIALLKAHENVRIQISWDGASEQTFDRIRGQGAYSRAYELLQRVVSAGLGMRVTLSMTVMKPNLAEIDDVIELAARMRVRHVHFPHLLPVGAARENWSELAPTTEELEAAVRRYLSAHARLHDRLSITSTLITRVAQRVKTRGCTDCLQYMPLKVNPDGVIFPCAAASNETLALGRVQEFKDRPDQLYAAIQKRYAQLVDRAIAFHDDCEHCRYVQYCAARYCENCGILHEPKLPSAVESHCQLSKRMFHSALAAYRAVSE